MKCIILFLSILLTFNSGKSQSSHELISKMLNSLYSIKSVDCDIISTETYPFERNFNNFINVKIEFDTLSKVKPLIKNVNYDKTTLVKDECKKINKIFSLNKLVTLNKSTKEILINPYISDLDNLMCQFEMEIAPLFYYENIKYIDSLFSETYKTQSVEKDSIKFNVTTDTACLSGDCFLITITAPSILAVGDYDEITQQEIILDFKDDIKQFWINKKDYFPERVKYTNTFIKDIPPNIKDYRFVKLIKDVKINPDAFLFDRNLYKNYRIEEWKSKSKLTTTQEAFFKAPDFKGITQNGDSIELYKNNSKLYIIDFWFASCPPCIVAKEFIENEIIPYYQPNEIMVIGINPIDKSFEKINRIMGESAPQYPYVIDKIIAVQYHLSSYPGIYLLNSRFEVIQSFSGFSDNVKNEIFKLIKSELK